ncbi:MAG: minor capsid protein [Bacilli bacterium]
MASVRINIDDTQMILLKRKLNNNGEAQKFFTSEVKRLSDPYVPFDSGPLKNTARVDKDKITYTTPYARRQWHEHKGNGLRGSKWCFRMWADRGDDIVRSVASFVGGRAE